MINSYSGGGMPMARHLSIFLSPCRYINLVRSGSSTIDTGRRTINSTPMNY